jgi:hypothetical protein
MPNFNAYDPPAAPISGAEQLLLAQNGATCTGSLAQLLGSPVGLLKPLGQKDWLSAIVTWPVPASAGNVLAPDGKIGLTFASRTSDLDPNYGSSETTIGAQSFVINDTAGPSINRTAYGFYVEARRNQNNYGVSFCMEADPINFGEDVGQGSPYHQLFYGSTVGFWCASGGGQPNVGTATFAYGVKDNGAQFWTGLTFGANALVMQDGFGEAIALAKGHMIQWYAPSGSPLGSTGVKTSYITCTVDDPTKAVSLQFQDNVIAIFGSNGSPLFAVQNFSNPANYIYANAATAGNPPNISAVGSDANITLALVPKGVGSVQANVGFQVISSDYQPTFAIPNVVGAANYLEGQAATAGSAPQIVAVGTDATINLGLYPKSAAGLIQTTAPVQAAAVAGSGGAIPANAATFMQINVNGTTYALPLFLTH